MGKSWSSSLSREARRSSSSSCSVLERSGEPEERVNIHIMSRASETVRVTSAAGSRRDHLNVLAAYVDTQGEIRKSGPTIRLGYLYAIAIANTVPTDCAMMLNCLIFK